MNKTIIFVTSPFDPEEVKAIREEIQTALKECDTPVVVLPRGCTAELADVEVVDTCEPECQDVCDSKCEPISQILSAADIEIGAVVSTGGLGVVIIEDVCISNLGSLLLSVKVVSTGNKAVVPADKCFRYTPSEV